MEEQMIFVDGGSRKQRELTFDIASFAWMKLMPRIRKCTVNFKLKKLKVYHGTCLDIGDREFDIEVEKRLSLGDDFITTIFHEMTHVKQLVYREFFTECNFYESREEYLNLPWEVEAYAKQEELLEQWNKHKKTS
tara:strand:+ start:356 stop:760 length:405 start_codon:yes stop_codon:yes gene_type:complete